MSELLEQIALCVEKGKVNRDAPFPPDMKGQEGADELTKKALEEGYSPDDILTRAHMVGMQRIGEKFRENKVFVPNLLMAAKAMNTAMEHLKPHFLSGEVKRKGTFVLGTVSGDLHDIGKNLVRMLIEGGGWEVVDLGVDVPTEKFMAAIDEHPGCAVGLSALLTTTMASMEQTVKTIKEKCPQTVVLVGGAPLNQEFASSIGADCYAPDPQGAVEFLNANKAA
jgi:methanogenic corrinoid protein MtbC1